MSIEIKEVKTKGELIDNLLEEKRLAKELKDQLDDIDDFDEDGDDDWDDDMS